MPLNFGNLFRKGNSIKSAVQKPTTNLLKSRVIDNPKIANKVVGSSGKLQHPVLSTTRQNTKMGMVRNSFNSGMGKVRNAISNAASTAGQGAMSVRNTVSSGVQRTRNAFRSAGQQVRNTGRGVVNTARNSISNAASAVGSDLRNDANKFKQAFTPRTPQQSTRPFKQQATAPLTKINGSPAPRPRSIDRQLSTTVNVSRTRKRGFSQQPVTPTVSSNPNRINRFRGLV